MAAKVAKAASANASETRIPEAAVIGDYAQGALEAARRVIVVGTGDAAKTFVLVQDQHGGESLKEVDPRGPHMAVAGRIVQRLTLETADSLVAYLERFKDPEGEPGETVLFASIDADSMVGVIDYHTPDSSGFGEHVATLALKRSEEWKAWAGHDGKLQDQLSFVRFLDENRADIVSPDAATLLELCKDLQGLRKADFRSVVRADSQNFRVEYAESAEVKTARGELLVPTEFLLRLPVYFGGEPVDLYALIIWEVKEGGEGLRLGYKLRRAEKVRQAVFLENVRAIGERAGVTVMHGRRGDK